MFMQRNINWCSSHGYCSTLLCLLLAHICHMATNSIVRDCFYLLVLSFYCPEEVTFTIQWYLKYYPCHNEFNNVEVSKIQ